MRSKCGRAYFGALKLVVTRVTLLVLTDQQEAWVEASLRLIVEA